jgi:hypothetical protein
MAPDIPKIDPDRYPDPEASAWYFCDEVPRMFRHPLSLDLLCATVSSQFMVAASPANAAEYFAQNCSLTSVDLQGSALSGVRKLLGVIFSYTDRSTDVLEMCKSS